MNGVCACIRMQPVVPHIAFLSSSHVSNRRRGRRFISFMQHERADWDARKICTNAGFQSSKWNGPALCFFSPRPNGSYQHTGSNSRGSSNWIATFYNVWHLHLNDYKQLCSIRFCQESSFVDCFLRSSLRNRSSAKKYKRFCHVFRKHGYILCRTVTVKCDHIYTVLELNYAKTLTETNTSTRTRSHAVSNAIRQFVCVLR